MAALKGWVAVGLEWWLRPGRGCIGPALVRAGTYPGPGIEREGREWRDGRAAGCGGARGGGGGGADVVRPYFAYMAIGITPIPPAAAMRGVRFGGVLFLQIRKR